MPQDVYVTLNIVFEVKENVTGCDPTCLQEVQHYPHKLLTGLKLCSFHYL